MSTSVQFEEAQGPIWCRFEIQVTQDELRFRVGRGNAWRSVALGDVVSARAGKASRWSWPVAYELGLDGSEAYVTSSGQGVSFELRGGRRLYLGSRRPRELQRASMSR